MFGLRSDGKKIKHIDPLMRVVPHIMFQRNDAMVMQAQEYDCENIDKYFDTQPPRESFAKTDEALRLRMSEETILSDTPSSKTNIDLTYKGPKEPGIIKTRREIICMVQNEKSMEEILTAVGFVMRCQVEKHRDVFSLQYQDKHIEILIDHIEKLPGAFMEAEIMVGVHGARNAV